jgi:hypothetical protein
MTDILAFVFWFCAVGGAGFFSAALAIRGPSDTFVRWGAIYTAAMWVGIAAYYTTHGGRY